MANPKAKTINLLLYEGDLEGVISIEDSSWNAGELYSAPRESVQELIKTDADNKFGVYLLLSSDMVYVGQASDLSRRISQHLSGKDWWESVVILTTSDNRFTHTDIDYLESVLIDKAQRLNSLDCDNKNKGNKPKINKFQQVSLDQYLEEALFLMELIGITVFSGTKSSKGKQIKALDVATKLAVGKRAKNEALHFLEERGLAVDGDSSYAVRQETKDEYWINPQKELLDSDWTLVLNDNVGMELVILRVPKGSINASVLKVRKDRPNLLDLNINVHTLQDRKTGFNFSPFLFKRVKYK